MVSVSLPSADPLSLYDQLVLERRLNADDEQRRVMLALKALYHILIARKPQSLWTRFFSQPSALPGPRSAYIWGDVGRGKSMLMDIFYSSITHIHKKRFHFHAFMQEVHGRIHQWRLAMDAGKLSDVTIKEGPLSYIAHEMVTQYGKLICLDELQVTDVADAMIVGKLFAHMLDEGAIFVITSNRPPHELYKGGLQREKFLEFVSLIESRMDVLELASAHDYRMEQIRALQKVYWWPLNASSGNAFERAYAALTHYGTPAPLALDIQGRSLIVEKACGGVARFSFAALCEKPLGPADYLLVASRFHTLFLSDIPQLGMDKRNEARRFITLIDALYDHKVKLICTSAAAPEQLYSGYDGAFEFQRTVSRLAEMQSSQYLGLPHII